MSAKGRTQAESVVKTLSEGDVVRVPQYDNALQVNFTGDIDGEENAMIGLEFLENPTGTRKNLLTNKHSGAVYLVAGATDKGHVDEIEVVA